MLGFEIDNDIRKAKTLPSGFYNDSGVYRLVQQKIFARSWQLVCREPEIANLLPFTFLDGSVNEPLLLTSDPEGNIRCISNVCTHRGKILVETKCSSDHIRCAYHGRKFFLDGKFRSMPEFEAVEGFPSKEDDLTPVTTDTWNGFVFCSLDPAVSLNESIGGMNERLSGFPFENLRFVSSRDYFMDCHWALYCENYLEGFHIPYVHTGLSTKVDYGSYTTDLFRYSSVQNARSPSSPADPGRAEPGRFENGIAAYYFFVFPNLLLNFYPWGISVNIVKPLGIDRTCVTYLTYVSDDSLLDLGAGTDLDRVELEDQAVVESVQKGIRSRFYDRGRYSPTRETGTHHFHRLIGEFMEAE